MLLFWGFFFFFFFFGFLEKLENKQDRAGKTMRPAMATIFQWVQIAIFGGFSSMGTDIRTDGRAGPHIEMRGRI